MIWDFYVKYKSNQNTFSFLNDILFFFPLLLRYAILDAQRPSQHVPRHHRHHLRPLLKDLKKHFRIANKFQKEHLSGFAMIIFLWKLFLQKMFYLRLTQPILSVFKDYSISTTKHSSKPTYRIINKLTKSLTPTPITITESETIHAIKQSKNNNSSRPDNINIKHLGPIAIKQLTSLYNITINTNTIPQIWETSKIIPIAKPNKNPFLPSSYKPIALLSPIAKTLEKIILPHITTNITLPTHQHGFRAAHSITTALHQINNTILTSFNKEKTHHRTILTALDMTKAFETFNIHQLIHKIHNTHIPTTIIQFLANYLKGRRQYTSYNNHTSKHTNIKAGDPQEGVLSSTLFNIYLSDIPLPKISSLNLITYADDITITSSHPNTNTTTQNLIPYLNEIHTRAHNNNPTKTTSTLMTPDPSGYNKPLNIHINNTPFPTTPTPPSLA